MAKITTSCSGSERPHLWCLLTNNVECVEYILIVIVAHKCQPSSRDQAHQYTDTTLHFGMYSVVSQHEKSNEEWLWSHHTTLLFRAMWHHWGCRLRDNDLAPYLVPYGTYYSTVWSDTTLHSAMQCAGVVVVYWCAWGLIYKMSYDLS